MNKLRFNFLIRINFPLTQTSCENLQATISNIVLGYSVNLRNDKYGPFATSQVVEAQNILNAEVCVHLANDNSNDKINNEFKNHLIKSCGIKTLFCHKQC